MPFKDKDKLNDWLKQNRIVFSVTLMKNSDSDIVDWLDKQPSRGGAIKDLIRLQIARENALPGDSNPT